jgi:hypothetical protein
MRNVLAVLREKFLQQIGKIFEQVMSTNTKTESTGRPTIDEQSLSANKDRLVDMLSCWWEEVGWYLPRATTPEELRSALEPLKEHPDRHLLNRLLLQSSDSPTPKQIRQERHANEMACERIYEAQPRPRECEDLVRQAESALGQASPEKRDAVEAQLLKRRADLEMAKGAYDAASKVQRALEQRLDQMEAGFAQTELLMFIEKRFLKGKYARNPLNLANAMAGLPYTRGVHFLGAWQSYARCSKLPCSLWPHHRFQVFETIQSIWKKSQKSDLPPVEFFHQEILALPRTVSRKTVDPVTKQEERKKSENFVRSYLLDNWTIWSLAILKTLESPVEPERMAFMISSNFTKAQRDPKTLVDLVLGAAERTKN